MNFKSYEMYALFDILYILKVFQKYKIVFFFFFQIKNNISNALKLQQ